MDDDAVRDHEPDRAVEGPSALDPLPPPQAGAQPLEGPAVPSARPEGDGAEVDADVVDDELLVEEAQPSAEDWSASSFTRPARPAEDEPVTEPVAAEPSDEAEERVIGPTREETALGTGNVVWLREPAASAPPEPPAAAAPLPPGSDVDGETIDVPAWVSTSGPRPGRKETWPKRARVTTWILAILAVLLAGAGVAAALKLNHDKDDLKDRLAASEANATRTGGELNRQLKDVTDRLDQAQKDLAAAQAKTTELTGTVTQLQAQVADLTKQRDDLTQQVGAVTAERDKLKGLFPIRPSIFATAGLDGTYATKITQQVCTFAACPTPSLTLTIALANGSYAVSDSSLGSAALGFNDPWYRATGRVAGALSAQCGGAAQPTDFTLDLTPNTVNVTDQDAVTVSVLVGRLVLSAPATTAADGSACPAVAAAYDVVASK